MEVCSAYLLRAAIHAHQGRGDNDFALAGQDAAKAFLNRPSDAGAVIAYVLEKMGQPAEATKIREMAKRIPQNLPESEGMEADADLVAAVHKCVVKLLPEIDKK